MDIFIVGILSYICGSIPFGLILTKFFTNTDIRKFGSGNIGATNVLRTGNKFLAITTLLLDALKGFFPVILTKIYYPEFIFFSCLLAFLGHVFPIWLRFKGGKGVATYLGILFALSLQLSLLFIFTWIILTLIFKYSSLSSIFASFSVFVISFIKETSLSLILKSTEAETNLFILLFIFLILIIFTHRKNIYRLRNKTEQKIKL